MCSNRKKNPPVIVEWLREDRGDNIAIKYGQQVFTVDCEGHLYSSCYKRSETASLENGTCTTTISGLSDLKVGYTFSISNSPVVIGKVLESHLFGYCFLSCDSDGNVSLTDIGYDEIVQYFRDGNIKRIVKATVYC